MIRKLACQAAAFAACALLHGCIESEVPKASAAAPKAAESARANELFARAFEARLQLKPELASTLGRRDNYDRWNDLSEAGLGAYNDLIVAQLEELTTTVDRAALDADTRLSYDLFGEDANREIEKFRWRHHSYPVNQMSGLQSSVPAFLIGIHRIETLADARAYIGRLEGIAPLFAEAERALDLRAKRGIIPPKFVFPYVLDDARNVISGRPFDDSEADSVLLEDFCSKVAALDLSTERRAELVAAAERALVEHVGPAYGSLIAAVAALEKQANTDDGAWKFPDGAAYYAYRLRAMTTTELTAEQIHQIGLDEVARIHAEMREIMQRVDFEGSLDEFFEFMRTDPQFYYPETEAGREQYLERATALIDEMRSRLDELFVTLPRAEIVVKAVEPFREKSAGKAFYQRATPDGSRPGVYYANLYRMSDMPIYEMEALAFHEGIPGHHMQRAITNELESLPEFRKQMSATAYTEGWGLYSEELAKEIGFYSDPYADFGRLSMELWRACRLVVDTGIHAKRWSREQAIEYLMQNTPAPRGAAVKAIERYIVTPGQATAYTIGKLKIMELRERAREQLAEDFDIREFHDVVLRSGPVTLGALEGQIERYVEDKGGRSQATGGK